MSIRISNIKIPIDNNNDSNILKQCAKTLHLPEDKLHGLRKVKCSLDARKKDNIQYIYSVDVDVQGEDKLLKKNKNKDVNKAKNIRYSFAPSGDEQIKGRIVIVGLGPAGLMCAHKLALWGYKPLVIERGLDVDRRVQCVEEFWNTGKLNPQTNVQFGEGGAGTFSDGKLNTMVHDDFGRIRDVFETFVMFGADNEILYKNKPHIGTDRLRGIVKGIREDIVSHGGEVRFETCLTDIEYNSDGKVCAIIVNGTERIECECVVLAIGHSSRDTFKLLYDRNVKLERKAFAMGVRVEHPQELISEAMYGASKDKLPAADYKLTYKANDGRGVYSFCMCPGGFVVNASSEEGRLVVNGMSNSGRDEKTANSALVVTVNPEEFGDDNSPLGGVELQRRIEAAAYNIAGGCVPVQRYVDFEKNEITTKKNLGNRTPNIKGKYELADLRSCLPEFISEDICEAMKGFAKQIKGFDSEAALFIGVETRTSSPVRITRDESCVSISTNGLYPCGEGAGYAGGITSAAVDGIKVAEAIASVYSAI